MTRHISFFVYIFCRLLRFSQILNMVIQDFQNNIIMINSQQKYSNFVYFGNYLRITNSIGTSAKCRSYTVMLLKADTLFSKTSHLFIRYAQLLHFMLFLLSKIVFYRVKKLKCKHVFRKIEIIHVWHIVSSVAQKRKFIGLRQFKL